MREKAWFPIAYMFFVTAVASSIILGFSSYTRARVEANRRLEIEKAVLTALSTELKVPGNATSADLHKIYVENIKEPDDSSAGAYRLVKDGKTIAYALSFSGKGFWDVIKGMLGVKADLKTVTGIAFHEQKETPGLGAEIVKSKFRNQFEGLEIHLVTGQVKRASPPIHFLPAGAELNEKNQVHMVTGATQTSTRLELMANEALSAWFEAMAALKEKK